MRDCDEGSPLGRCGAASARDRTYPPGGLFTPWDLVYKLQEWMQGQCTDTTVPTSGRSPHPPLVVGGWMVGVMWLGGGQRMPVHHPSVPPLLLHAPYTPNVRGALLE